MEPPGQNHLVPVGTAFSEEEVSLICQALLLGAYRFDLYKGEKGDRVKFTVYSERDYSEAVAAGKILAESTNFARDLVNTAPSDMTPILLAQKAAAQAELCGVSYEILGEREIEELGMGSFLAVAGAATIRPG